jgi:hypothetical protein
LEGPTGPTGEGTTGPTGPTGVTGPTGEGGGGGGGASGFSYLFNTETANVDPGSGTLMFDETSPELATTVRISQTDDDSAGIAEELDTTANSYLTVRNSAVPGTFATYTIRAVANEGAYDNLTVAFVAGNGSFANEDPISVEFTRAVCPSGPTLGKGCTEKGTWAFAGQGITPGIVNQYVPISFTVPLAAKVPIGRIIYNQPETEHCPGEVEAPSAEPGYLCIYQQSISEASFSGRLRYPTGVVLQFATTGTGAVGYGTWAVTAE